MEFAKNGKKMKNGVRQDEQLLISYSGNEHASESDSDRVKPLELPPTRLRRPKSRKIRVSSTNAKSVFSFWNFCQVLFVIVVIGTMVCMVWFTIVLKTSLEHMKKRVSILETSDRSTSKECANSGKDLKKKLEALRGSAASVITSDEKHFKTLLQKISVLNKTVELLKTRLKSPRSVSSIQDDIKLLKKAMADTSREMTEVTDKVTQLRRIAHLQNSNIKHLKVQMYNVSVQLAKLSGQPTPRPVINTATPPWLFRVPADGSDQATDPKVSSLEIEKLRTNITTLLKKDMGKIVAYVKKANKSVHSQVHDLQVELSALTKSFAKQKDLIEKLIKKTHKDLHKDNISMDVNDESIEHQISNLTTILESLTNQFGSHNMKFEELAIDVTSINNTIHQHVEEKNDKTVSASCNCSLDRVWKAMSNDEQNIKALQSKLDDVRKSIENLNQKKSLPTSTSHTVVTGKGTTVNPTTAEPGKSPTTAVRNVTSKENKTSTVTTAKPTTSAQQASTSLDDDNEDAASKPTSLVVLPTTKPTSSPTVKEDKRNTGEELEDEDLDLENSDDIGTLSKDLPDSVR